MLKATQQTLIDARVDDGDNTVADERVINSNFLDILYPATYTIIGTTSTLPNTTINSINTNISKSLRFKKQGNIVYFYGSVGNPTGSTIPSGTSIMAMVGEYAPAIPAGQYQRMPVTPANGLGIAVVETNSTTHENSFLLSFDLLSLQTYFINGFYFVND